jgi:hypothetical protein
MIGKAMYCPADLDRFVERVKAGAARRMGSVGRRGASLEMSA